MESENERLKEYRKNHSKTIARLKSENTELEDRIAELKKEKTEQLKQFAERLKEKLEENIPFEGYDLEDFEFDGKTIQDSIDETLEECIK